MGSAALVDIPWWSISTTAASHGGASTRQRRPADVEGVLLDGGHRGDGPLGADLAGRGLDLPPASGVEVVGRVVGGVRRRVDAVVGQDLVERAQRLDDRVPVVGDVTGCV